MEQPPHSTAAKPSRRWQWIAAAGLVIGALGRWSVSHFRQPSRTVKISKCAEGSWSSMMDVEDERNHRARLLAYVTGLVNQELLLQNEYLAAENRILKTRLQPGWRLSDGERATLA
jgi:hypothetical protein